MQVSYDGEESKLQKFEAKSDRYNIILSTIFDRLYVAKFGFVVLGSIMRFVWTSTSTSGSVMFSTERKDTSIR